MFLNWQDRYDKAVVDREYFPQFDESSVDALLADQLNTLIEGLDVNYWCRFPNCGFMTLNSCWIVKRRATDNKPLDYSCPACLQRYRPWSQAKGQRQGQFCLVLYGNNRTPDQSKADDRGVARMWICEWADTSQKILQNEMKAIFYGVADQYKDKPFEEVTAALAEADRSVHRAYMTPYTLKDKWEGAPWDREEVINYAVNKWDMTEAQKGFPGAVFHPGKDDIVLGYKDVVRIFGLSVYYSLGVAKSRVTRD